MYITLKKYHIFRNALGDNYKHDDSLFEKFTDENGRQYERLKDIEYAKKVLDAYYEVEKYCAAHPEPAHRYSDNEAEKIAKENENRWKEFGDYYYEMFSLVMAAHNTFVCNNMKHKKLYNLVKTALLKK